MKSNILLLHHVEVVVGRTLVVAVGSIHLGEVEDLVDSILLEEVGDLVGSKTKLTLVTSS